MSLKAAYFLLGVEVDNANEQVIRATGYPVLPGNKLARANYSEDQSTREIGDFKCLDECLKSMVRLTCKFKLSHLPMN
jgi:hypothetical protein